MNSSKLSLLLFTWIIVNGCTTEKIIVSPDEYMPQREKTSRVIESQRRLADLMDSWSDEQIEDFKRDFVFSKVNFIRINGDTLTVR